MDQSTDLMQRLARLETWARYERERTDYLIAGISQRVGTLERHPLMTVTASGAGKILIAIALPVLVWLVTGDLRQTLTALLTAVGG